MNELQVVKEAVEHNKYIVILRGRDELKLCSEEYYEQHSAEIRPKFMSITLNARLVYEYLIKNNKLIRGDFTNFLDLIRNKWFVLLLIEENSLAMLNNLPKGVKLATEINLDEDL